MFGLFIKDSKVRISLPYENLETWENFAFPNIQTANKNRKTYKKKKKNPVNPFTLGLRYGGMIRTTSSLFYIQN